MPLIIMGSSIHNIKILHEHTYETLASNQPAALESKELGMAGCGCPKQELERIVHKTLGELRRMLNYWGII